MNETRKEIIKLLDKAFIKKEIPEPQAILAELDKILTNFETRVKNNVAKSNVSNCACVNCDTIGSIEWTKICSSCGKEH
jgi:hypothetical protein